MSLKTHLRKRGEVQAEAMASMLYVPKEVIFATNTCVSLTTPLSL